MNLTVGSVIAAAILFNIAALLWLIWWTARRTVPQEGQQTTHLWDDDLTEHNNPLPRWWLWMFVLTIVFGLGYLLVFPGLGSFRGLSGWTSRGQYRAEEQAAAKVLQEHLAGVERKSIAELSRDPAAMATARNLFALNCSTCHGSDARGAKGFPNLTDNDWLWGGDPDRIYQTIANGRDNSMPAWGPILESSGVEQVLAYVLTLSGRQQGRPSGVAQHSSAADAQDLAAGQQTFETLCAGCHGADGRGNQQIGAPNLTDNIWLHGGSTADIRETITHGRVNHMPAHLERLGETRVKLLAAYVVSLSPRTAQVAANAPVPQAAASAPPSNASAAAK